MAMNPILTAEEREKAFQQASSSVIENGSETQMLALAAFDVSGSVSSYIDAIKTAAKMTVKDLKENDVTRGKVTVCWTFFGVGGGNGVSMLGPKPVDEINDEDIDEALCDCGYGTPGEEALEMLRVERKKLQHKWIKDHIDFYVPLQFMVTDLEFNTFTPGPNGAFNVLLQDSHDGKINLIPIMTPNFNNEKAKQLYPSGEALMLEEQNAAGYAKLFSFVKESVRLVSESVKGDEIRLPDQSKFGIGGITIKV